MNKRYKKYFYGGVGAMGSALESIRQVNQTNPSIFQSPLSNTTNIDPVVGLTNAGNVVDSLDSGNQYGRQTVGTTTAKTALQGAAFGMTVGGPIGAGIGAVAGGVYGFANGKNQLNNERRMIKQKEDSMRQLAVSSTRAMQQSNPYIFTGTRSNMYRYGGKVRKNKPYMTDHEFRKFAYGGSLTKLNSKDHLVVGNSHEEGGVKFPQQGVELEGGETKSGNFIFSKALGFAQRSMPLMIAKGTLEKNKKAKSLVKSIDKHLDNLKFEQEAVKSNLGINNDLDEFALGGPVKPKSFQSTVAEDWSKNWFNQRKGKLAFGTNSGNTIGNIIEPTLEEYNKVETNAGYKANSTLGLASPDGSKVYLNNNNNLNNIDRTSIGVHELGHQAQFQNPDKWEGNVENIISKKYNKIPNSEYYSDPREVHSRIMQLRFENNLQPNQQLKLEDIKSMRSGRGQRSDAQKALFDMYDDSSMLDMLNNLAMNNKSNNKTFGRFGGKFERFLTGGPVKPTRTDSLNLYNRSLQVQKYYDNDKYNLQKGKVNDDWLTDLDDANSVFEFSKKQARGKGSSTSSNLVKNFGITTDLGSGIDPNTIQYRKQIDENQFEQREFQNSILDTRSPMPLYDRRIKPQIKYQGTNGVSGDIMNGDAITIYNYDPVSIKPFDMLNPQERIQRGYSAPVQQATPQRQQQFTQPPARVQTSRPQSVQQDRIIQQQSEQRITPQRNNETNEMFIKRLKAAGQMKFGGYSKFTTGGRITFKPEPNKDVPFKHPKNKKQLENFLYWQRLAPDQANQGIDNATFTIVKDKKKIEQRKRDAFLPKDDMLEVPGNWKPDLTVNPTRASVGLSPVIDGSNTEFERYNKQINKEAGVSKKEYDLSRYLPFVSNAVNSLRKYPDVPQPVLASYKDQPLANFNAERANLDNSIAKVNVKTTGLSSQQKQAITGSVLANSIAGKNELTSIESKTNNDIRRQNIAGENQTNLYNNGLQNKWLNDNLERSLNITANNQDNLSNSIDKYLEVKQNDVENALDNKRIERLSQLFDKSVRDKAGMKKMGGKIKYKF